MWHVVLVLVAVAVALHLLNKHIPSAPPWLALAKTIVSAVVTVLALVWALIVCGYAASDGPLFPRHFEDPPSLHERR